MSRKPTLRQIFRRILVPNDIRQARVLHDKVVSGYLLLIKGTNQAPAEIRIELAGVPEGEGKYWYYYCKLILNDARIKCHIRKDKWQTCLIIDSIPDRYPIVKK